MPNVLESGKLQLSPEEAVSYRAAAERLHEACAMALDLERPITLTDLILLSVARAGLEGDTSTLDVVISKVQETIGQKARLQ